MRKQYKDLGYTVFLGKESWQSAKSPDNAIVYDFVDALLTMRIPLLDTVRTKVGLFLRRDPLYSPEPYKEPALLFPTHVKDTGEMCFLSLRGMVETPHRISLINENPPARK